MSQETVESYETEEEGVLSRDEVEELDEDDDSGSWGAGDDDEEGDDEDYEDGDDSEDPVTEFSDLSDIFGGAGVVVPVEDDDDSEESEVDSEDEEEEVWNDEGDEEEDDEDDSSDEDSDEGGDEDSDEEGEDDRTDSEKYGLDQAEGTTINADSGMIRNPEILQAEGRTDTAQAGITDRTKLTSDAYTTTKGRVKSSEFIFSSPLKKSRAESRLGLGQSVKEYGILSPIHVMVTEAYDDWVKGPQDHLFAGQKYLLLDGFRRVLAGTKNRIEEYDAVIYDFKDKEYGQDIHVVLSLMLNKVQRHTWTENWHLFQHLEEKYAMSPGTLEYLLSLEGGQAMKLKDIMSCDFPEVIEDLVTNKKTVDQAYNALQKARKEIDAAEQEEGHSISSIEDAADMATDVTEGKGQLTSDEVANMLDLASQDDGELTDENFGDPEDLADILDGGPEGFNVQSSKDRERLEPALRQAVLIRDDFRCDCCKTGGTVLASALVIHHMVPVSCDGPDTMENLITVCQSCHLTFEALAIQKCRLFVTKEEVAGYSEEESFRIRKIMKYARLVYDSHKLKNLKIKKTPHGAPWAKDVVDNGKMAGAYNRDKFNSDDAPPEVEDVDDEGSDDVDVESMKTDYEEDM